MIFITSEGVPNPSWSSITFQVKAQYVEKLKSYIKQDFFFFFLFVLRAETLEDLEL